MPDTSLDKVRLRQQLRAKRRGLTPDQQSAAAQSVAAQLAALPHWHRARRIALYLPADGEIDTAPLATLGRKGGKALFLPVIRDDDCLTFTRWDAAARLVPNRYGIPEPPASAGHCDPADLDVICLPLVGWDRRGGRLGMGGGFYDRTLADAVRPLLIGLAHACQEVGEIPLEQWDVRLDFVVTGAALHDCRG